MKQQTTKEKENPPKPENSIRTALIGCLGGFITIFTLLALTNNSSMVWVMAPFGGSCVLVFGLWNSPLSQPRNIIGGHLLSTLVALTIQSLWGNSHVMIALAVGISIALMILTKTTHPPAGANPLVVMMGSFGWSFLLTPVLVGSLIILFSALIVNNIFRGRKYPQRWF